MNWPRIWECLTRWRVEPGTVAELKQAQVILTQCAEFLRDNTPGPGNILIAEHADKLRRTLDLPVIAPREIAGTKTDLPLFAVIGKTEDGAVPEHPEDTHALCLAQKKICDENHWKKVLVVAFPEHMWRACEIYKKLGLEPIPAVMLGHSRIYYHPEARRWQLRNRFRFKYFWEIPTRLLFLRRGWL